MEFDELSNRVIGCAIAVHRALGPGLLESAYEQCLARELALSDIEFQVQTPLPVEVVEKFLPIHEAQILTYMKLAMFQ